MGEVLAGAILLVVVVSVLVGSAVGLINYWRRAAPDVDSPMYRNHLAMARWIEHGLADDMERATVPDERQHSARKLLSEFYKEKETK